MRKHRFLRPACLMLVLLVMLVCLIGPALIPIPPVPGAVPAAALAGPDSRFVTINGLEVHHQVSGTGEPSFVLLHGLGASTFTWREVMPILAERGTAITFDRPGFGLSGRPLSWDGANPYTLEAQTDLVVALLDEYDLDQAVLVGNSAGGTVALYTALRYPERVRALVLVDAAVIQSGGPPPFLLPALRLPLFDRLGPLFVRQFFTNQGDDFIRSAYHDPSRVTPEVLAGYQLPLRVEQWDQAFWQFTLAAERPDLVARLDELTIPVLVLTGDDDRIVPTADSVTLAGKIPGSTLAVLPECGHLPQEECPALFLAEINSFLDQIGAEP